MNEQKQQAYQSILDLELSYYNTFFTITTFFLGSQHRMLEQNSVKFLRVQYFAALRSIIDSQKLLSRKLNLYSRIFGFDSTDKKNFMAIDRKNFSKTKRHIQYVETATKNWDKKQKSELSFLLQAIEQSIIDKRNMYKLL